MRDVWLKDIDDEKETNPSSAAAAAVGRGCKDDDAIRSPPHVLSASLGPPLSLPTLERDEWVSSISRAGGLFY